MKNLRHSKICEIINSRSVETQDELQALLKAEDFHVTQATVSRDIKALGISKVMSRSGRYRYALPSESPMVSETFSPRLRNIFRECVTDIDTAQNIVVIKTLSGMGQAAGAAVDAMNAPEVVGCLAGDDTAFIAMRGEQAASELMEQLRVLLA